jgi:ParB-like chromosome segregation protein Spo0J
VTNTNLQPSNEVAAVRAKLMEDLASIDAVAGAVGKSPRTIARMIARGELPTITIGRTPYVIISHARELLMAAPKNRHEPARRGRPSRQQAA